MEQGKQAGLVAIIRERSIPGKVFIREQFHSAAFASENDLLEWIHETGADVVLVMSGALTVIDEYGEDQVEWDLLRWRRDYAPGWLVEQAACDRADMMIKEGAV